MSPLPFGFFTVVMRIRVGELVSKRQIKMANDTLCSFNIATKDMSNQIKASTTDEQYQDIISWLYIFTKQHRKIHQPFQSRINLTLLLPLE